MTEQRGRPGKDIRGAVDLARIVLEDRAKAEAEAKRILAEAVERQRARLAREHAAGLSRNGAIRSWRA